MSYLKEKIIKIYSLYNKVKKKLKIKNLFDKKL